MKFPYNVYLLAATSGFAAALLSLPFWREWCRRTGLVDDPGRRKIHQTPTPLAGGLAVATGLVIPALLGAALLRFLGPGQAPPAAAGAGHLKLAGYLLGYGLSKRALQLGAILAGAVLMLGLGLLDDKFELRARTKFAGQLLIATLVAAGGARITLFVPNVWFSYALTIFWILTVINAFNFMDNMNGLCAGLGAIGAWIFAVAAGIHGQYLVASIAFLIFGALAGFLPYNYPKATAFLGDSGSHLAGYLLAVLAILPHFYSARNPRPLAVLAPLLVLAVPLGDMAWVVWWRWRRGKPFYEGDTNHLSHRLAARGLSRARTVALIWLLALAVGVCAWAL